MTIVQKIQVQYHKGELSKQEYIERIGRLHQVDTITRQIKVNMTQPGIRPLTNNQVKVQADYRRQLASQIKLSGGEVEPDYEN